MWCYTPVNAGTLEAEAGQSQFRGQLGRRRCVGEDSESEKAELIKNSCQIPETPQAEASPDSPTNYGPCGRPLSDL